MPENPSPSSPLVSVLLPAYNGSSDLRPTIDYVLKQTLTEFELLLLDDGSTDNTWEIIEEYAARDSRIRTFRNLENRGVVASTITLTDAARGDILIKEDCGDLSDPQRYQAQYDLLMANPEATACVTDYWLLEPDYSIIGIRRMPPNAAELAAQVKISNATAHQSFAMRKSAFQQAGGYDTTIPIALDYDILLKLMELGPVVPINKPLVAMKLNPFGITFRNLKKQDACVAMIKARRFGGVEPEKLNYDPLPMDESEAAYHLVVGKMHLAKGRPQKARRHFAIVADKRKSKDMELLKLNAMTWIPGSVVHLARKALGKNSDEETIQPFF